MKKTILALIFSSACLAGQTSFWLSADLGTSFVKNSYKEETQMGLYAGGKGLVSWDHDTWIMDAGLGIGSHSFSSSYGEGELKSSDFNSLYGYMAASPRLKLNKRLSLGLEAHYSVFNSMLTGVEEQQNLSAGLAASYGVKISEKYDGRINLAAMRGIQEKSAQTLVLSFQIGMDGKFGVEPRPERPRIIYVPKPDPKKLYGPLEELDLYDHDGILQADPQL